MIDLYSISTTAKPERCGRIRNFKKYEDVNKCVADREVDLGYCYGGCENDETSNNDMCCAGTQHEYKFVIMECPDGTRKNKFVSMNEIVVFSFHTLSIHVIFRHA